MCKDYDVEFLGAAAAGHRDPRAGRLAASRRWSPTPTARSPRSTATIARRVAVKIAEQAEGHDSASSRTSSFRTPEGRIAIHACVAPHSRRDPMSIKSDKWIRRMAAQHGMIEPFEPGQVQARSTAGAIVSYGTSSYGYDIRCSDEFKIFTNINSTIVDPEEFRRQVLRRLQGRRAASSRPTPSRWRAPSSTSASRATCSPSAWASPPTRAAASSST